MFYYFPAAVLKNQVNNEMNDRVRTIEDPIGVLEHKIRLGVSQEEMRKWMKPRPARVIADLLLNWFGIILAIYLMGYFKSPVAYVLGAFWIGFRQYALFIMGHDGAHWCLHTNHKINDWLSRWFILGPMFMSLEDGRRNHLEHHKTLGTAADPDRYLHSLSNKNSVSAFLLFCSGLATFGKTVRKVTTVRQPAKDVSAQSAEDSTEKDNSAFLLFIKQRIPILVAQPPIIALFWFCQIPLWLYPLLWIAPIYFGVFLPDEIRAFCDHAIPSVPDEAVDVNRLVSFEPTWLEAMVYSPYNMNYHAEHHIWPGVPYYNRPQVYQFLKSHPAVTYRKSYTVFLFSLVRKLPLAPTKGD
jgi:fatty acid desaturase